MKITSPAETANGRDAKRDVEYTRELGEGHELLAEEILAQLKKRGVYIGLCIAGAFAMMPGRFLFAHLFG